MGTLRVEKGGIAPIVSLHFGFVLVLFLRSFLKVDVTALAERNEMPSAIGIVVSRVRQLRPGQEQPENVVKSGHHA